MTRKSPIKHKVRDHTRRGKPVHQYERGDGDPEKPKKRYIPSVTSKPRKWRITRGGSSATISGGGIVSALRIGIDSLPDIGETVKIVKVKEVRQ